MTETRPFKDLLDEHAVAHVAALLARARPAWDPAPFRREACDGLGALELKARVRHVAAALQRHLHPDFEVAVAHVLDALPPPLEGDEDLGDGFALWPLCHWVELAGLDHHEAAMRAMRELTRRCTAEFAVRPFLVREPERTLAWLRRAATDPDPHVRRWVSEGTRPRLPWGQRLPAFVRDPGPVLELLELLKDDPSPYVRRSVANHLNDIAKDHPARVVEVARRWRAGAGPERARLIRHALRTLVKAGDPSALEVLGVGAPRVELTDFTVTPDRAAVGDTLVLTLALRSTASAPQDLIVDYTVHHVRASGGTSPKVFKWSTRALPAGAPLRLVKRHSLRPVTTRRYHDGEHRVEVMVNGEVVGAASFTLTGG